MDKIEDELVFEDLGDAVLANLDNKADNLCCSKNDKFLVPIFAHEGELKVFRGNGVIVGHYLVSAAHVAQSENERINYDKVCFIFNNIDIFVDNNDLVFDGRTKDTIDGCNNDLIIYKLHDIVSEIVCNEEEPMVGTTMFSWRCRFLEGEVHFNGGVCSIVSLEALVGKAFNRWRNCFNMVFSSHVGPGNSGSGVFIKDVLYGILIEAYRRHESYGIVLDARYIKYRIDESECK